MSEKYRMLRIRRETYETLRKEQERLNQIYEGLNFNLNDAFTFICKGYGERRGVLKKEGKRKWRFEL